jgi:hypothetical protein
MLQPSALTVPALGYNDSRLDIRSVGGTRAGAMATALSAARDVADSRQHQSTGKANKITRRAKVASMTMDAPCPSSLC